MVTWVFVGALGLAAPAPKEAGPAGVFVLDNCDPVSRGKDRYADGLARYDPAGGRTFRAGGLNVGPSVGPAHLVAADPARGCVWVLENVARRVRKFDREGKELLALDGVRAHAIAVDPATGNLWVLTTGGTIYGDGAVVYSPAGKELVTHEVWGQDLAYDPAEKAFWLIGKTLYKVPADRIERPLRAGALTRCDNAVPWCGISIAADPKAGRVWVVAGYHPDVAGSKAELLGFDREGKVQVRVPFPADGDGPANPSQVAADPAGGVWVVFYDRAIHRYGPDGKADRKLDLPAIAAQPDGSPGGLWVATREEVLRVDRSGAVRARVKHAGPTSHAWLAGE
jgi:hypothetical protein